MSDRVEAAKSRLQKKKEIIRSIEGAGPPCWECRFKTAFGNCANPVYLDLTFEPATGAYKELTKTRIETARSPKALCGPDALLMESLPIRRYAPRNFIRAIDAHPWRFLLAVMVIWTALDLLLR
jgi:hypothetical protein